jgi:hypothetical protein
MISYIPALPQISKDASKSIIQATAGVLQNSENLFGSFFASKPRTGQPR